MIAKFSFLRDLSANKPIQSLKNFQFLKGHFSTKLIILLSAQLPLVFKRVCHGLSFCYSMQIIWLTEAYSSEEKMINKLTYMSHIVLKKENEK